MEDKINHPAHYTKGIECADFIESHEMDFSRVMRSSTSLGTN